MQVKRRLLIGLFILGLLVSVWVISREPQPARAVPDVGHLPAPAASDRTGRASSNQPEIVAPSGRSAPDEATESTGVREARGAGYIWGDGLKHVFATTTTAPDGRKRLNVTPLVKSFEGVAAPVDLADSTVAPSIRAEYLAAVIVAALDQDVSSQPALTRILTSCYEADAALPKLETAELNGKRTEISAVGRTRLATALPSTAQEQFKEVFRSPMFLFETRSIAADSIEYQKALADGNVVFRLQKDGALSFTADQTSFMQAPAK
jgi:hypothetical protein